MTGGREEKKYGYNIKEVYALVLIYCSKVMQNGIETYTTYHPSIQYNPIELSNTTKVIMNDPDITKYPYAS